MSLGGIHLFVSLIHPSLFTAEGPDDLMKCDVILCSDQNFSHNREKTVLRWSFKCELLCYCDTFPHPFLWKHHVYSPSSGYFKVLTHQPSRTGGHYWHGFATVYLLHSCSSFHSPGRMYSHRCPARSCRSRAATAAAPWRVRTEGGELRGERWGAALDHSTNTLRGWDQTLPSNGKLYLAHRRRRCAFSDPRLKFPDQLQFGSSSEI